MQKRVCDWMTSLSLFLSLSPLNLAAATGEEMQSGGSFSRSNTLEPKTPWLLTGRTSTIGKFDSIKHHKSQY